MITVAFESIDWTEPSCKISQYFTVKDAIFLNNWGRLGRESDGLTVEIKRSLWLFANEKMDTIRRFIGRAIYVKSWWRPKKYNIEIGGASYSSHMAVEVDTDECACDWWADMDGDGDKDGADCDAIKALLMPKLQEFGVRMENNGKGAKWIHNDNNMRKIKAGGAWFFLP